MGAETMSLRLVLRSHPGLPPESTCGTVVVVLVLEQIMTSFDTDGFLSAEISEIEESIATTYSTRIGLAREANRLTHQVIFSVHVQNEHLPDLLLASLLIRQASLIRT